MSIIHNMASMNAQRQYKITSGKRAKSAEKLSSGYRINRSADDAAGLQISEKMRWQIRGLNKGQDNIMEGISWIQVGDGAMDEVSSMLHRMTELCVQAANDTNTDIDREAIQEEINELKKEINRVGDTTEFNTQQVFQNEDVMMDIDGAAESFNIFNASYDDQTGKVEYGGFVIGGTRIAWDNAAIQPADANTSLPMVATVNGEQVFNEGTYKCTVNGETIEIRCEAGAKVPELSRIISVSASAAGISVDGVLHNWNELKDEAGKGAGADNAHGGVWTLEHNNSSIAFYMPRTVETIDDMIKEIEACRTYEYTYTLKETYVGPKEEQAVDANATKGMIVTNSLANNISGSNIAFTVRADDTGAWLEENGTMVADSKQSWATMGINSWDSGSDIKANYTYIYHDNDGSNDTNISFEYTLSDVTSVDSVIDGLDGMLISGNKVTNDYDITIESTTNANIFKADVKYNGTVTFEEEKELGRDFDTQTIDKVASDVVDYDKTTGIIAVEYVDASQNAVLSYTGIDAGEKAQMTTDINKYVDYVLELKKNAAMAGKDPQLISIGTVDLTKVVGSDKITTSGHFDSTVKIDSNTMTNTDGGNSGWNGPGVDGETYPTAFINFSEMGADASAKYTIDNLWSAGFNSTCKTCSNHYSIVFTDVSSGTTMANGYKYNKVQDGLHYTLEIDVNSLKSAGVDTGKELAEALVAITADDFDFHYTQYAAKGGVLYIYDNREQTTGTTEATFDTYPFEPLDIGEYSFNLTTGDGRSITLDYTYSYSDIAKDVVMEWEQDNSGEYVKITSGSSTYYEKYDSTIHTTALDSDRYNLKVTYNADDGNGGKVAVDKAAMIEDYSEKAIKEMLTGTTVNLNAKDFTTIDVAGEENPNVAIRSLFETDVDAPEYQKGINIQCSSNEGDSVKIPRFALHTVALRLYRMNVMSHEGASEVITNVQNALNKLSGMRSTYGAYQNRLEHTYASRGNMEENTQIAESRIRDTNMADEMVELSKYNILAQVGEAMMAQANQSKQGILQLLQ